MDSSSGDHCIPIHILSTDTISELYGRKVATHVVWYGFGLSIAMVILVYTARILPAAGFWLDQDSYDTILGSVPRIALGSMIAYLISQHTDVVMFHALRRLTNSRHLWIRNNASTTVSQALDTILFISIAFGGGGPGEHTMEHDGYSICNQGWYRSLRYANCLCTRWSDQG